MHFKTELIQAGIAPMTPIFGREASYRVNRIHIPLDGRAKYRDINGKKELGLSVEVNHRFIDGYHIGKFAEELERLIAAL